jgi:hypothetical protein
MAREGYFILDSDLHLMEPYDLWGRYLEGPHKANPPHFFAAHRRPEEEIKVRKILWDNCARLYGIPKLAAPLTRAAPAARGRLVDGASALQATAATAK